MKRVLALIFCLMTLISLPAFAMDITNELTDISWPVKQYRKVGTATLQDQGRDGYLILSLSASPDAVHTVLDMLDNTYGSITNVPGLSDYLPGGDYIDMAKWGIQFVDSTVECYMQLRDPHDGHIIWDGTWEDEKGNDYPFHDGKIIRLGNDHPAYEVWLKAKSGIGYTFARLTIADNVAWTNP